MKRLLMIVIFCIVCDFCLASPPGGPPRLPKANAEAEQKLREAYACYVQGWYERAIELATEVYSKYGDVRAKWFPSWVRRIVKGKIPDPYDKGEVLGQTLEGGFLFTMAIKSVFPSYLLARSYAALGEKEKVLLWSKRMIELGYSLDAPLGPPPSLSRTRVRPQVWHPLPLRFREEDYFILVPLDEACKVLGLSYRFDISPKTKRVRYVFLGEKGKLLPGLTQARNIKGEREDLAYACFEEDGEIWVPFYWLAKQAGIRWWEVRNGKIYVASK